jgi:hypothetical protein
MKPQNECLAWAAACEQQAERALDENIRQGYLSLAEQWRLLARQI